MTAELKDVWLFLGAMLRAGIMTGLIVVPVVVLAVEFILHNFVYPKKKSEDGE